MKRRKEYTGPVEFKHDMRRGKWKTGIMWQIYYRKNPSLSQLQKDIKGISQKILLEQLNELLEYKLLLKEKSLGYPLNVQYYITDDKGMKVIEALKIYQKLGEIFLEEINSSKN